MPILLLGKEPCESSPVWSRRLLSWPAVENLRAFFIYRIAHAGKCGIDHAYDVSSVMLMYEKLLSPWIIPECTFETYPLTWKISLKCPVIQALLSIHLLVLLKPRDYINSLWTDKQGVCFLLDLEGITLSVEGLTMLFVQCICKLVHCFSVQFRCSCFWRERFNDDWCGVHVIHLPIPSQCFRCSRLLCAAFCDCYCLWQQYVC